MHRSPADPPAPATDAPEEEKREEDAVLGPLGCIANFYAGFQHPEQDKIFLFINKHYYMELEPQSKHRRNKFPKVSHLCSTFNYQVFIMDSKQNRIPVCIGEYSAVLH